MNTTHFKCVSVSFVVDGCQIYFHNGEPEDDPESLEPYFLIQRLFEPPDDGSCYIETSDIESCGHFHFREAELSRNRLRLNTRGEFPRLFDVTFEANDRKFMAMRKALRSMIRRLVLK